MITDLRLQNFRSYDDASFELSPGVNIVVGPNASGKTNLLEAVLVLARGSSYRARDGDLVRHGSSWARLDSHDDKNNQRTIKITKVPSLSKSYELEGKIYKRITLAHSLPVVLFEPNHLQLLAGGPERRRDYLDDLLEQTTPGFGATRRQYRRTLAQRNNLLKKNPRFSENQMFPWNVRLSHLAGQIVRRRYDLIADLSQTITGLYKELSHSKTAVSMSYGDEWPPDSYETKLLKSLELNLQSDLARGFTGHGPHREDMLVTFDGRPAQETASRGEVRTAVLALKIAELQVVGAARGRTPLLLLDDVFSELDGRRRHALTDYLAPFQTFITTTDADIVTKHFTDKTNIIALT